jgi:LytTR family transcriptional regulator, CO-responsive transcriptional regulator RcoM
MDDSGEPRQGRKAYFAWGLFFASSELKFVYIKEVIMKGIHHSKPRLLFKLPVCSHDRIALLDLDDVTYIESSGHYSNVYTLRSKHFCNLSMHDMETRLDSLQFIRVHRSYMINIKQAKSVQKINAHNYAVAVGDDSANIPIARSRFHKFKMMIGLS